MTTSLVFPILFGLVAASVAAVLVIALRRGRVPAVRRWAWIVGIVLALLGTAFNLFIVGGMTIATIMTMAKNPSSPVKKKLKNSRSDPRIARPPPTCKCLKEISPQQGMLLTQCKLCAENSTR